MSSENKRSLRLNRKRVEEQRRRFMEAERQKNKVRQEKVASKDKGND